MAAKTSGTSPDKRRKYDEAFKAEALRLAGESCSTQAAARQLGIIPKLLYRWQQAQLEVEVGSEEMARDPEVRARLNRAEQLQRDPLAHQALVNELDELLEHWPYKRNRILYLLATHEALVQRGGRAADESQLLDPGNPARQADRAQRLQRAAARAADPQRADRHHQAEREARSWLDCQKLYGK